MRARSVSRPTSTPKTLRAAQGGDNRLVQGFPRSQTDPQSATIGSMKNLAASLVLLIAITSAAIASAAGSLDLHDGGDLHEGIGQTDLGTNLQQGSAYTASRFALPVTIRAPDALWGGVQQESGSYRFVQLGHFHHAGAPPLSGVGFITLESATVATPSAAKALANLRATPHMIIGPSKAVTVAGLRAEMFDATITALDKPGAGGVSIAPFTVNRHCGFCTKTLHGETGDVKVGRPGELFRMIVLQPHGKTVVIYIESNYADQKKFPPTKIFPTFLPYAQKLLAKLSFS